LITQTTTSSGTTYFFGFGTGNDTIAFGGAATGSANLTIAVSADYGSTGTLQLNANNSATLTLGANGSIYFANVGTGTGTFAAQTINIVTVSESSISAFG
jgi:hypothetical protein